MPFDYVHDVRLDDVDRFDIVFYPRVFVWVQRASEALFEAGGTPYQVLCRETGHRFPIVATDATYARPIEWGDAVTMAVTPSLGRTSFTLETLGRVAGEAAFEVSRTQVAVDEDTGEKAPLPDEVRSTLEPFAA